MAGDGFCKNGCEVKLQIDGVWKSYFRSSKVELLNSKTAYIRNQPRFYARLFFFIYYSSN